MYGIIRTRKGIDTMKKEKSCGAVVFKKMNSEIKFLVEEMNAGHFALPKGHAENNETEIDTAKREIKEETNLNVTFLTSFKESTNYNPEYDVNKDVIYFLAEANCYADMKAQKEEVKELYWLNYNEAIDILTFDSDKTIISDANEYLKGMK